MANPEESRARITKVEVDEDQPTHRKMLTASLHHNMARAPPCFLSRRLCWAHICPAAKSKTS
ncbi:hypothetical protein BDZ89DRAFT_1057593, partial [Hymenopellis radicata]